MRLKQSWWGTRVRMLKMVVVWMEPRYLIE
jgi:hypothetical protein